MSLGVFGSKKLADVTKDDVDVLYSYSPSQESVGELVLKPMFDNISPADFQKLFGADGVYKMRLPAAVFTDLGYYTILVKPKAFETQILDCSFVVSTVSNQVQVSSRGIVIPNLRINGGNSLVGYQIEYFDSNGQKIRNNFKIITTSDIVSPSTNTNTANPGSKTYTLDPNGSFLFLTVTPSEGGTISNNKSLNIGTQGQTISISNTFFDPFMLEVQMVDQNIKTLSYGMYGNSTRDLETGIYTIFDETGKIYKQYTLGQKKKLTSNGIVDFRQIRNNVNLNLTFNDIINRTA
jgi:hypothetical protein